jgi:murein DD-endopeptidase MepM/ murein hydrolase activator NlpD
LGVYLLLIIASLSLAPRVIRDVLLRRDIEAQALLRTQQGTRLELLTRRLAQVRVESEELRGELEKIYLAYGLSLDQSGGQGGYPAPVDQIPESVYAPTVAQALSEHEEVINQLQVLGTFQEEIENFEAEHRDQIRTTPSLCPLRGTDFVLTSPFGTRRSPFTKKLDFHPGLDLAAPSGMPVLAPADGTVLFAGRYPLKRSVNWWRYGNMVMLRHGERFITVFGHLKETKVKAKDTVTQGAVLGTVGNTGWSTSPHLHYEVRSLREDGNFRPVDPRIYILDRKWSRGERLMVLARNAPDPDSYEPIPGRLVR